jgi:hypothetical protein
VGEGGAFAAAYAASAKTARTHRLPDVVYSRVEQLVWDLRQDGVKTSNTEILQALLHFELPGDTDAATDLVRRWRRATTL